MRKTLKQTTEDSDSKTKTIDDLKEEVETLKTSVADAEEEKEKAAQQIARSKSDAIQVKENHGIKCMLAFSVSCILCHVVHALFLVLFTSRHLNGQ